MKNTGIYCLILICCVLLAFMGGLAVGRNISGSPIRVSTVPSPPASSTPSESSDPEGTVAYPININTADEALLCQLPGIGEVLAGRIMAFREENGPFTDPRQLMLVEGIGQSTFEELQPLITTGG